MSSRIAALDKERGMSIAAHGAANDVESLVTSGAALPARKQTAQPRQPPRGQ